MISAGMKVGPSGPENADAEDVAVVPCSTRLQLLYCWTLQFSKTLGEIHQCLCWFNAPVALRSMLHAPVMGTLGSAITLSGCGSDDIKVLRHMSKALHHVINEAHAQKSPTSTHKTQDGRHIVAKEDHDTSLRV